jgi:hypothetical protein
VDPRAALDDLLKGKFLTLPGLELQPLSRPARSQSLYRLRYPGSLYWTDKIPKYRYYWIVAHIVSMTILDCTFP